MKHYLKSCYICGGVSSVKNFSNSNIWTIECNNHDCVENPKLMGENLGELIKEWNSKNKGYV